MRLTWRWRWAVNQLVSKLSEFDIRSFIALSPVPSSTCSEVASTEGLMLRAKDGLPWRKGKNRLSRLQREFQRSPQSSKGDAWDETINTIPQINNLCGWEWDLTPRGSINAEKWKAPQRRATKVYRRGTWNSVPSGHQVISGSKELEYLLETTQVSHPLVTSFLEWRYWGRWPPMPP